jgi:DNA-binding HxlR family transcriptional regulator
MKKMTIKAKPAPDCPSPEVLARFHRALAVISGKWTTQILYSLSGGTLRFGELRRAIPGITQHMLTSRLRELEADGLVMRRIYAEVPPRVEYALTPAALALAPVFKELMRWAEEHQF